MKPELLRQPDKYMRYGFMNQPWNEYWAPLDAEQRYSPDQARDDHGRWGEGSAMAPKLNAAEAQAVLDWTANSDPINQPLREGVDPTSSTWSEHITVKYLDELTTRYALDKPLRVYRATSSQWEVAKGEIHMDAGFASATTSRAVAEDRLGNVGAWGHIVAIDVPAGAHVANIESYSVIPAEHELMFARETAFRVVETSMQGEPAGTVHMEVLLPGQK